MNALIKNKNNFKYYSKSCIVELCKIGINYYFKKKRNLVNFYYRVVNKANIKKNKARIYICEIDKNMDVFFSLIDIFMRVRNLKENDILITFKEYELLNDSLIFINSKST